MELFFPPNVLVMSRFEKAVDEMKSVREFKNQQEEDKKIGPMKKHFCQYNECQLRCVDCRGVLAIITENIEPVNVIEVAKGLGWTTETGLLGNYRCRKCTEEK